MPPDHDMDPSAQEEMAKTFHARYVAGSARRLPPNMRPWDKLEATFKRANLEQAHYSVEILEAAGFEVQRVDGPPVDSAGLHRRRGGTDGRIGARPLEHRAPARRLAVRQDAGRRAEDPRLSRQLAGAAGRHQGYDRDAVRVFPEILAKAGLEVRRQTGKCESPCMA